MEGAHVQRRRSAVFEPRIGAGGAEGCIFRPAGHAEVGVLKYCCRIIDKPRPEEEKARARPRRHVALPVVVPPQNRPFRAQSSREGGAPS